MDKKKEDEQEKGKETETKDTSEGDLVSTEAKFDQDGNEIVEEPEKETPPEKDEVEVGESPPKPPDTKKYKHATLDESEKAYSEAEKRMHEATSEAANLRKRLAQLEKPPEKPSPTIDDKIKEITRKTVKDINAISLEYDSSGKATKESIEHKEEESAFLWARLQSDIADIKYEERAKRQETERNINVRLYESAQKEGLKTDEDLRILGYEFSRTDPSLSADDRIRDAVENAKNLLSKVREGWVRNQEKDKKERDSLRVLGGGSRTRSTDGGKEKTESKPTDMFDALKEIRKKRAVKKDDLLG